MLQSAHMQFSSWNVNGLRAVEKKGFFPEYVASGEYDVVFLMETKSEVSQLSDAVLHVPAYSFTLQPSTYKKGYAGVGAYVRNYLSPVVETGFSHESNLHDEERVMTVSLVHPKHGRIAITGAYFPNGARGSIKRGGDDVAVALVSAAVLPPLEKGRIEEGFEKLITMDSPDFGTNSSNPSLPSPFLGEESRKTSSDFSVNLDYKLAFFGEFHKHMTNLQKAHDHVFVCGDINIAHHPIDLARPESNKKTIGFLPIERAQLDEWHKDGWVDIWRELHGDEVVYSYWDVISGARQRNVGWRIDAWWCHKDSLDIIKSVSYETEQMGSDHCPVVITLK